MQENLADQGIHGYDIAGEMVAMQATQGTAQVAQAVASANQQALLKGAQKVGLVIKFMVDLHDRGMLMEYLEATGIEIAGSIMEQFHTAAGVACSASMLARVVIPAAITLGYPAYIESLREQGIEPTGYAMDDFLDHVGLRAGLIGEGDCMKIKVVNEQGTTITYEELLRLSPDDQLLLLKSKGATVVLYDPPSGTPKTSTNTWFKSASQRIKRFSPNSRAI